MTNTANRARMPGPGDFVASMAVGAAGDGSITLLPQRAKETLYKDRLLFLMAGSAIGKWQTLTVWPFVNPTQFRMTIYTGKVLVGSAHEVITGNI